MLQFDQRSNFVYSRVHELSLRFQQVVPVGRELPYKFLWSRHKVQTNDFQKPVFQVLDDVKTSLPILSQEEHGEVLAGVLVAVVKEIEQHAEQSVELDV